MVLLVENMFTSTKAVKVGACGSCSRQLFSPTVLLIKAEKASERILLPVSMG